MPCSTAAPVGVVVRVLEVHAAPELLFRHVRVLVVVFERVWLLWHPCCPWFSVGAVEDYLTCLEPYAWVRALGREPDELVDGKQAAARPEEPR